MGTGGPLRQAIPAARSILWSPAGEGSPGPGELAFPVFLSQTALSAIHEHVAAPPRPGQGALGFLLGDLCECPETNVSYLVIDAAVRLNLAIYSDRTRDVVTRLWDRVQAQLEEQKAYLIGWYHTHAPLPLTLSEYDVETHEQYFGEPWQVALLLGTDPAEPSGAFFRASPDETWVNTPLPFYELLNPDSIRPDGRKRSFVTWRNYHAQGAAAALARSGPHAAVAPQRPAEPKFTPSSAKPKPPPSPPASEPPPRRPPEPEKTSELRFLTAAEDMPPPLPPPPPPPSAPPRRHTPPPRAAVPPAPPPSEPELEEAHEPQASTDAGGEPAAPVWPDEFERADDTALEQPAEFEEPPRSARRRRRLPRKVRVTLLLLVIAAAGAGAFWWFQPALPSLPDWSTVASKWSALTTKVSALATKVWALKGTVWPSHRAAAPVKPPPKAAPKPKPTPPPTPTPTAAAPVSAPARATIDLVADTLTQTVRDFGERAGLFARGQLPCGGLARSLSTVEKRWLAYNTARRAAGVLDAAHAARDQTLYAGVDSVERRFDQSGCPRP